MLYSHIRRYIPLVAVLIALVTTGGFTSLSAQMATAALDEMDMANRINQLSRPLADPELTAIKVPELYEGELEDIGPQFLLLAPPRHKYFQFLVDMQAYRTSNATLVPSNFNPGSSDITVATFQGSVISKPMDTGFGQVQLRAGMRYQFFWYGLITGRNDQVSGFPVKDNDFNVFTPFVEALWQKDGWFATAGVRYLNLYSPPQSRTTYEEVAPYWIGGYQFVLSQRDLLLLQYDGNFRFSSTKNFGLLPAGINNRTDQAFSLIYSHLLTDRFIIQPSYRFQYSYYTDSPTSRNDIYNTLGLLFAYYITDNIAVRVFGNWENRDSSSRIPSSYRNWNLGGGANLTFQF